MSDFRLRNALTQNIYLVKMESVTVKNHETIVFHVLGNSKTVYKITFTENDEKKCTCPDNRFRHEVTSCKHIYFITNRLLEKKDLKFQEISNFVINKLPHLNNDSIALKYAKALDANNNLKIPDTVEIFFRNQECHVCLEDLPQNIDLFICDVCKNALHSNCWVKWKSFNRNALCIYCRSKVNTKESNSSGGVDFLGNIKL
jgi:hypothetical protein